MLYLVQEILPAVSGLTRHMVPATQNMSTSAMSGAGAGTTGGAGLGSAGSSMTGGGLSGPMDSSTSSAGGSTSGFGLGGGEVTGAGTTSQHYALVESEHPYKPATVVSYKVGM